MSLTRLTTNYAAFNFWANKRIVNWLSTQEINLLSKEVSSSYPSIDLTLQHILRAERFWHLFIMQQDFSHLNWNVRTDETVKTLNEVPEVSEKMAFDFKGFSEETLLEELHLNMPWLQNKLQRYEYIIHVVNHSSYHRGQIITMARSLGITEGVPNTDYNYFNTIG